MLKKALILTTALAYAAGIPVMAVAAPVVSNTAVTAVSGQQVAGKNQTIDVKKKKKKKEAAPSLTDVKKKKKKKEAAPSLTDVKKKKKKKEAAPSAL
jgi:hypothetical protein